MFSILSEKEYQRFILDRLKDNGYEIWKSDCYDCLFAVDRKELFRFLNSTQPETMKALNKIYKGDTDTLVEMYTTKITEAIQRDKLFFSKSKRYFKEIADAFS